MNKKPFFLHLQRSPVLPVMAMWLWSMLMSWLPSSTLHTDQIGKLRWFFAGRPMLHLTLGEQGHSPKPKKYQVSIRWNGSEQYLAEFAVSTDLLRTLSFAAPPERLQAALQVEVKIAGLDENGCIIEGGAQHIDLSARHQDTSLDEEIHVDMKALPHALCIS